MLVLLQFWLWLVFVAFLVHFLTAKSLAQRRRQLRDNNFATIDNSRDALAIHRDMQQASPLVSQLPNDIFVEIFSFLDVRSLCRCERTCRLFLSLIEQRHQHIWKEVLRR
jgi:hypothetical protein